MFREPNERARSPRLAAAAAVCSVSVLRAVSSVRWVQARSLLKEAEGSKKLTKAEAKELDRDLRHDINTQFGTRNENFALSVYERRSGTEVGRADNEYNTYGGGNTSEVLVGVLSCFDGLLDHGKARAAGDGGERRSSRTLFGWVVELNGILPSRECFSRLCAYAGQYAVAPSRRVLLPVFSTGNPRKVEQQ